MDDVLQAEHALRQQLTQAGLDCTAPYLNAVWRVFRLFNLMPQDDGGVFAVEKTSFKLDGGRLIGVQFIRHIAIRDGNYDSLCLERLQLKLRDKPFQRASTRTFFPAGDNGFNTKLELDMWTAEFSRSFI